MKKIWYLEEVGNTSGNPEKKCVKLFIYEKKGQAEGKLDLSAFSSMEKEMLSAKKVILVFFDVSDHEIGTLDLTGRDELMVHYLKGKGKIYKALAKKLAASGEKLQLKLCMEDKQFIPEGYNGNVLAQVKKVKVETVEENIEKDFPKERDVTLQAEELLPEEEGKRRIVQLGVLEEEMIFRNFLHNSFLLHGYYNYGHIIIDETVAEPRLGVPGNYYEREQMVATMFGFPHFEPARDKDTIEAGTFGYYYTSAG